MPVNTSAHPHVLRETDQDKEHRGIPRVDTLPEELCSTGQAPPWNPVGPHIPDEGATETFVGGAGI